MLSADTLDPRNAEIERQVPDLIDLTVMAVEAGVGIDQALDFIAQHLAGRLAEECRQASEQAKRGQNPGEAWLLLTHRLRVSDFSEFVGVVLQSGKSGTSMGSVLRQKAEEIRQRRVQRAREEANRLPVKLVFVNVVLVPLMVAELVCFLLLPFWLVLALLVPPVLLLLRRRADSQRKAALDQAQSQLSQAVGFMASALRVGHGPDRALGEAAQSVPAPVGPELARAAEQVRNGVGLAEALAPLAERFGERELSLLITGAALQRTFSGNLAPILDEVSRLIADRVRVRNEIGAITAQSQFSSYFLIGIPLALATLGRLVGVKLTGVIQLPPLLPVLGIAGIYAVQSTVLRTVKRVLGSVEQYMP
jgi:Flp pilus assembly protein TadB